MAFSAGRLDNSRRSDRRHGDAAGRKRCVRRSLVRPCVFARFQFPRPACLTYALSAEATPAPTVFLALPRLVCIFPRSIVTQATEENLGSSNARNLQQRDPDMENRQQARTYDILNKNARKWKRTSKTKGSRRTYGCAGTCGNWVSDHERVPPWDQISEHPI